MTALKKLLNNFHSSRRENLCKRKNILFFKIRKLNSKNIVFYIFSVKIENAKLIKVL